MSKLNTVNLIIVFGAFNAFIAVAAGAFAAHGLKDILSFEYLNTFKPLQPRCRCLYVCRHYLIQRQSVRTHTNGHYMAGHYYPVWRHMFFNRMVNAWL